MPGAPTTRAAAVVGMSGRFPGAGSVDEFWDNIVRGRESISRFSADELRSAGIAESLFQRPNYVPAKGVVAEAEEFDAALFGYSPREARRMDPQLRLLHTCAWEALEDAGYRPRPERIRVGLYVGVNENHAWVARASLAGDPDAFLLNHRDYAATRVAHAMRFRGPALTVLTACSTSLVAVHLACQALRDGSCDVALAGGVSLSHPLRAGYLHQEGLMHSADGHCRTFDAEASGTVFGDGAGLVVLRRLDHALDGRDPIRALIRGTAVNNDGGRKAGFTAPSDRGQRDVIHAALRDAGVESQTIGYVEAHGTATQVGDPIELNALAAAFGEVPAGRCAIGSAKTNIGHVNVAAGASALIKTVKMLEAGMIPPHLHFVEPNGAFDFAASPFYVPTELASWERGDTPRRAGVSGFGFGGTNAHVVLEEAEPVPASSPSRRHQIVTLSARTARALDRSTERLGRMLSDPDQHAPLAEIAFTLSTGREPLRHRRAVVTDERDAAAQCLAESRASRVPPNGVMTVFLFPGQGAQFCGMGKGLYSHEPTFRDAFDDCCRHMRPALDGDLREVVFGADPAAIARTYWAQPAIFAVSYAAAQMWTHWVGAPDIVLGHSLGEISAACVAGVFSLESAAQLVARRARMMQEMPMGSMLAVAAAPDAFGELPNDIVVAARNAAKLTVLSGPSRSIERLGRELRKRRIPVTRVQTSHAFHSPMMAPVVPQMLDLLEQLDRADARTALVSTVTGRVAAAADLRDAEHWLDNLRAPVRFAEAVTAVVGEAEVRETRAAWIEIGPGSALTSLIRTNLAGGGRDDAVVASLSERRRATDESATLARALSEVWRSGVEVDWDAYYVREKRRRVHLPTYPFEGKTFATPSEASPASAASGTGPHLAKLPQPANWLHVPSWRRTPAVASHRVAADECWLVFAEDRPLWIALIEELEAMGVEVAVVRPAESYAREGRNRYRIDPTELADYEQMFDALAAEGIEPARVLHAWSPATLGREEPGERSVADRSTQTFYSLLYLAQALGGRSTREDVLVTVVTAASQQVDEAERLDAVQAIVGGPVRVISQEYASLHCLQLDLEAPTLDRPSRNAARRVIAEASEHRGDVVVAHRRGTRWSRGFEPLPLPSGDDLPSPYRDGATYLITGGTGGLGLAFARAIATEADVDLVLTGRKGLPPRDAWQAILAGAANGDRTNRERIAGVMAIEALGSRVHVIEADICDEDAMRRQLDHIVRQTGNVDGVIHAAGIPGEGIIQLKGADVAAPILAPKVQGTLVLERIFSARPLDFMVLCSSIASVLGGVGLVDYSAANHFLDAFAQDRRDRPWRRLVSINWDMWGEVGMGLQTHMPDELQEWFANELAAGLTSEEGVAVLRQILAGSEEPQVVVSTRDLQARIDLWVKRKIVREREQASEERRAEPRFERPDLSAEFVAPEGATEEQIARVWADLFEIERVGRHDSFFELGGHSLLAAVMLTMLGKRIDVAVPISAVAEHPTVAELASFCEANEGRAARPVVEVPV